MADLNKRPPGISTKTTKKKTKKKIINYFYLLFTVSSTALPKVFNMFIYINCRKVNNLYFKRSWLNT